MYVCMWVCVRVYTGLGGGVLRGERLSTDGEKVRACVPACLPACVEIVRAAVTQGSRLLVLEALVPAAPTTTTTTSIMPRLLRERTHCYMPGAPWVGVQG